MRPDSFADDVRQCCERRARRPPIARDPRRRRAGRPGGRARSASQRCRPATAAACRSCQSRTTRSNARPALLERREARTDVRPKQPLGVRVDVDEVAHSDDGNSGGPADAVELRRDVRRAGRPTPPARRRRAGPSATSRTLSSRLLLACTTIARSMPVDGEHRRQVGRPEVAVDGRHRDRDRSSPAGPIARFQRCTWASMRAVIPGATLRRCGCQSAPGIAFLGDPDLARVGVRPPLLRHRVVRDPPHVGRRGRRRRTRSRRTAMSPKTKML